MGLAISSQALPNGLRIVLVRDPKASEVAVTMRYEVGSVDDPPDRPGMAHLVEHLMYQQVLGSQSLFAHLEASATYFNGATTYDATTYVARAAPAKLDELLSIEAVRVGFRCTSISDAAFERERQVVINELRQRDAPSEMLTALHAAIYPPDHPYRRAVGGSEDTVAAITRAEACRFADAHYAPNNGVLVISGNVSGAQVESALNKFLARVARRPVTTPVPVPVTGNEGQRIGAKLPVDDPMLIVAWPLPDDPALRVRLRAIARALVPLIENQIQGSVALTELGDERARRLAFVVSAAEGDTADNLVEAVRRGIDALQVDFSEASGSNLRGKLGFAHMQHGTIYQLYASLEDATSRDAMLAREVAAGRDPNEVMAAEFTAIRRLTYAEAASIIQEELVLDHAVIVNVVPAAATKHGHRVTLTAAIHELGQRRDPPDPALAHQPAATDVPTAATLGMRTRTLGNGLQIVMLPLTSVPAVEMRLVFRAGIADEPVAQRGVAYLAAKGLTWDLRYVNDLLLFAAAGGAGQVEVGDDDTTFSARGVDMHLDLLLSGLRRWVREGHYDDTADALADALHERKRLDDDDAVSDAWRAALFGATHPYAEAGLRHRLGRAFTVDDAEQFRAAHYTPDNATLVIAGHFDPDLADRWVDYLFADWKGHAAARAGAIAAAQPASIAQVRPTEQLKLQIALPAASGDRAKQLVIAAMLDALAMDIRHQLGASYGFDGWLAEARLSSRYELAGWIDAARASDAVQLLSERIAALRSDPDAAARAFVTARARVLLHLTSLSDSADGLARRVEHDIALGREPLADLATAAAVKALTIDDIAPALADLDLARAAVLMRGPEAGLQAAFAALGRTPTYVHVDRVKEDSSDDPLERAAASPTQRRADNLSLADIQDAISQQAAPPKFALAIEPAYAFAQIRSVERLTFDCCTGGSLDVRAGYQVAPGTVLGLHAAIASLTGTYRVDLDPTPNQVTVLPIDAGMFVSTTGYARLWFAVSLGVHWDRISDIAETSYTGIGVGVHGGMDLISIGHHHFGVSAGAVGLLGSESGYGGLTTGIAYRVE